MQTLEPSADTKTEFIPSSAATGVGAAVRERWLIVCAAFAALLAKLYCAATTIGTTDTFLFRMFGRHICEDGLVNVYRHVKIFNHTPLVGEFAAMAWRLEQEHGLPLHVILRLPGIAADFLAIFALLWLRTRTGKPPLWSIALFALSPVCFMISGYHGNVDSVLAAALLFAACCCVAGRPLACGLMLGLACNVKIIALMFAPIFFFFWLSRRGAITFGSAAVVATLAGWAVPLLEAPSAFLSNVLGYGGYWGDWGITFLLNSTGLDVFKANGFRDLSPAQNGLLLVLKLVVIVSVLGLGWWRRNATSTGLLTTIAAAWAVFFVFAPGGAPQYLAWLAPFVAIDSARWFAALTATSSAALFVFYNTISKGMPWFKGISTDAFALVWRPWMILPWLLLVAYLVCIVPRLRSPAVSCEKP